MDEGRRGVRGEGRGGSEPRPPAGLGYRKGSCWEASSLLEKVAREAVGDRATPMRVPGRLAATAGARCMVVAVWEGGPNLCKRSQAAGNV